MIPTTGTPTNRLALGAASKKTAIRQDNTGGAAVIGRKLRDMTAERSHNVYRPDIYRVSEGYLS